MLMQMDRVSACPLPETRTPSIGDLDVRGAMRNYILENFLFTDDRSALNDHDSFLDLGLIDSVGALEIALYIEQTFGFAVGEDELLPENLDSVDRLTAFVERRLREG